MFNGWVCLCGWRGSRHLTLHSFQALAMVNVLALQTWSKQSLKRLCVIIPTLLKNSGVVILPEIDYNLFLPISVLGAITLSQ